MSSFFFQQVRIRERQAFFQSSQKDKSQALIGGDVLPSQEKLRFKSHVNLRFPAQSIEIGDKSGPDSSGTPEVMFVNFLQLVGAEGVLPPHYTRLVVERMKHRDYAMADFLDMFHHRLVSLFYRSWVKYRLIPQYEASFLQGIKDPVTRLLDGLIGNVQQSDVFRYYAGHYSRHNRSVSGLTAMLQDYLQVPVKIDEHIGSWFAIPDNKLTRLGSSVTDMPTLGKGISLGRRVWCVQSTVRIRIGPLDISCYKTLTPGEAAYQQLVELIRYYVPLHMQMELIFEVINENAKTAFSCRPQLAKTMWLSSQNHKATYAKINIG